MILPETYVENKISQRFDNKFNNSDTQSNYHYKSRNNNINNATNAKQVYYEVGCKIFEMNKIYK